jgi:hypothetical protein
MFPAIFLFTLTINLIRKNLLSLALIFRRRKSALSHNPLRRVAESDFPPAKRKVHFMATEESPKPTSQIPTAASSWGEDILDLLNAKFNELDVSSFDIAQPFGIPEELQVPPEKRART